MTPLKRSVGTLCFMLACVAFGFAQESNIRVTGTIGASSGLGYRTPAYGASLGMTKRVSSRLLFDGMGTITRSRKIPGDGFSFGFTGEMRIRKSDSLFYIAGATVSHQLTNSYQKTSTNVFGGLGVVIRESEARLYLSARYMPPDFTSPNKIQRAAFHSEFYKPLTPRLGLYQSTNFIFHHFKCYQGPTGLTQVCNGVSLTTGIGVYWSK